MSILMINLTLFNLMLLYELAAHAFYNALHWRAMATTENSRTDEGLQDMLYDIDICYILGALTGSILLWTLMDFVMTLQHQPIFPTVVMELTFVCVALHYTSNKSRKHLLDKDSAYYALQNALLAPIGSPFSATIVWQCLVLQWLYIGCTWV